MPSRSFFAASLLPIFAVIACGGATTETSDPASSQTAEERGTDAAPPPPPAPKPPSCPAAPPVIGSACTPPVGPCSANGGGGCPSENCTYGSCSGPNGAIVLACVGGKWEQVGGARCGDAGSPPPRDGGSGGADAASSCASGGGGNARGVCSSDLSFFESAEAACAGTRSFLTGFTADEKCGAGSSSSFTYTCCAASPKGCAGGAMQNANGLCSDDGAMFASAEQSCTATHGSITAFTVTKACSASTAQGATYTCCP